jgi:uncharacterized Zn-binding protein involved in type VI secretion
MPPAARITDQHVCPMVNPGPVPHVGGPTTSGEATVIIGFQPAARVGDSLLCVGPGASDSVSQGEPTVIIGGSPAARLGDPTSHGGVLVAGCPTVIIGSSVQSNVIQVAASNGTPFCEECEKKRQQNANHGTPNPDAPAKPSMLHGSYDQHFLLSDEKSGKPLAGIRYLITTESGQQVEGRTSNTGLTAKVSSELPESVVIYVYED